MTTRQIWLSAMLKIADPVLRHLAEGTLKATMPTAFHPDRKDFMHLEALGRTMCGVAPWLELTDVPAGEAAVQAEYRALSRKAIAMAVDPASPDYMNFTEGYGQALVDAAFLSHAIVRAPEQLYRQLPGEARRHLADALRATRRFTPCVTNWLLFSSMVEAALYVMGEPDYDLTRVEYGLRMFERWYVGDGHYGDGDLFHMDYYNSFVIQPMLVDILRTFREVREDYPALHDLCIARAARYAEELERFINADGTYPVVGRSVTYRFGAFQALSQAAQEHFLPSTLPAAQVRCALTAVIRRVMENPDMVDACGWLRPGVYGEQPGLAEGYICVGSLYLCQSVFLPLGLPETDPFWADADLPWTARRIWSGMDVPCDHALD